jgi:hypothetical protein
LEKNINNLLKKAIYKTRYKYFGSGIIYVQNWRVCALLKCILAIQKQLTNRPQVITNQRDHRWTFETIEKPWNIPVISNTDKLFCFNNNVSNLYNNSVFEKINGIAYIFTLLMFRKPIKTTINKNKTTICYRSTLNIFWDFRVSNHFWAFSSLLRLSKLPSNHSAKVTTLLFSIVSIYYSVYI